MVAAFSMRIPTVPLPSSLASRMSIPNPADGMTITLKTKFKWDTDRLKKQFDAATRRGLMLAGKDVRGGIQSSMSQRKPLTKPKRWKLTDIDNTTLIALVDRPPKEDAVTSWKTRNFPKGFLRTSIQSDWDFASKSVVAGAHRGQKAADLQNLGGSAQFHFVPRVKAKHRKNVSKHSVVYGQIVGYQSDDAILSFRRRLKPRAFIEKGTAKAIATKRMARHFADQINGP